MNSSATNYSIKKKEIVDTLVKLMDEEGLKNVTVQEICSKTDISVGTFYYYFKSKDTIVDDMYELMDNYFIENEKHIREGKTLKEQILIFTEKFAEYVYDWGYYANLLIVRSSINEDLGKNKREISQLYKLIYNIIDESKIELDGFTSVSDFVNFIFVIIRGNLLEWAKFQNYNIKENMTRHMEIAMDYFF